MVSIAESANAVNQGNSDLSGLQLVSLNETIQFTQYIRKVLPLDGYVFWLRTKTTAIRGSLHATMTKRQNEDETITINRVVFSTGEPIQEFNEINPSTIWVGEYEGFKFAFTVNASFYKAANVYHYMGDAVYPALETQLVDVGSELSDQTLIVSNSLPLWLALSSYSPVWLTPANPVVTLYPSFAVPDNLRPPYGTVHIDPTTVRALQPTPTLVASSIKPGPPLVIRGADHYQLTADKVRVTLYGLTNAEAADFLDLVNQYSYDQDAMGNMSASAIRDEKRTQAELGILAMKKTLDFEVSYYQARVNDVARQLLTEAIVTYFPSPLFF